MKWGHCLLEVYCLSDDCERSLLDHLEYQQGGFCEGHVGDYLHALGLSRMLREYFAVWWEAIYSSLRWHLYRRWVFDDKAFMKWMEERTLKRGQCPVADNWPPRCKFPEDLSKEDHL